MSRRQYLYFSLLAATAALLGCNPAARPASADAVEPLPPQDELRARLDAVLEDAFHHRRLTLRDHAAWQILHGAVAFRREFPFEDHDGKLVPAVDYLLQGGEMSGWTMQPGEYGPRAVMEQGSATGQGHHDQWLAILASCGVQPDETLRVGDREYTMADYVQQVKWDIPRNLEREYSWTIVGLTTYLPTTHSWVARDGRTWTIEQLVAVEADYPIGEGACGGTHRLSGLAVTLNRHLAQGHRLEGPWAAADERVQEAIERARQMQNPDGSFSTNYFDRPGQSPDLTGNLHATGHFLEFLTLSMSDEQLQQPWVARAVVRLCEMLEVTRDVPVECGALYHAVNGLVIYRQRMFGQRSYRERMDL